MNPKYKFNKQYISQYYFYKMILSIYLPIELTNLILEFSGYHKLRNGQYMKQIAEPQLFNMAIKIQRMPKITNGYIKIKVEPTTTSKETITLILYNSPSIYKKSSRL